MENFLNRLTDMDWGWWPFISLRPNKNEEMNNTRVAKIAAYFGGVYGALLYLAFIFPKNGFNHIEVAASVLSLIFFFFVFYRFSFAYSRNKRAKRLQNTPNKKNDF